MNLLRKLLNRDFKIALTPAKVWRGDDALRHAVRSKTHECVTGRIYLLHMRDFIHALDEFNSGRAQNQKISILMSPEAEIYLRQKILAPYDKNNALRYVNGLCLSVRGKQFDMTYSTDDDKKSMLCLYGKADDFSPFARYECNSVNGGAIRDVLETVERVSRGLPPHATPRPGWSAVMP